MVAILAPAPLRQNSTLFGGVLGRLLDDGHHGRRMRHHHGMARLEGSA